MIAKFNIPIRVYWEDTDAGGVVYHACYVNFFERARTEWLRDQGLVQSDLQQQNLLFAIHRMSIDFVRAARLDDQLKVTVAPVKLGAASMVFKQHIYRCNQNTSETNTDELIARADVYAACLSADDFVPMRIPANIKDKLESTISTNN